MKVRVVISFCTGLQDSWYIADRNFANQIIPWFRQILLFQQLKFQWLCSASLSFLSWWKCGGSGENPHISKKNFQEIEIFPKPTPKTETLGSKEKTFKYQSQEKYMGIAWKTSGKWCIRLHLAREDEWGQEFWMLHFQIPGDSLVWL